MYNIKILTPVAVHFCKLRHCGLIQRRRGAEIVLDETGQCRGTVFLSEDTFFWRRKCVSPRDVKWESFWGEEGRLQRCSASSGCEKEEKGFHHDEMVMYVCVVGGGILGELRRTVEGDGNRVLAFRGKG